MSPSVYISLCLSLTVLLSCSCSRSATASKDGDSTLAASGQYTLPDTLVAVTLYGPDSYFLYRDEQMGYQYELISRFAKDNDVALKMVVASSLQDMIKMINEGKADVIACDVPETKEYNSQVLHCGPENETHQVLVQRTEYGKPVISDVTQLPGKDIYVEKDSKYHYRLENLSKELGGGIHIHPVDADSMATEDLIEMVVDGAIPFTVIDSDIARFSSTYYKGIDVTLAVGMEQRGSWAVGNNNRLLARVIDEWAASTRDDKSAKEIYRRYYVDSKRLLEDTESPAVAGSGAGGRISQYDEIFRRYAGELGWDWKMLAAQAYVESRFDVNQVSWAGARGLMQLMPRTAAAQGLGQDRITDPELNVKAAVKVIAALDEALADKVPDRQERLKFILAAYNSGIGHILDAIAIADKNGMNPRIWDGNVRKALLLKSNPDYYRDPAVKCGYFKGTQTVEYVDRVLETYKVYAAKE